MAGHRRIEIRHSRGRNDVKFWAHCLECGAEGPLQPSAGLAGTWADRHRDETTLAELQEAGVVTLCACGLVDRHYGPCRPREVAAVLDCNTDGE